MSGYDEFQFWFPFLMRHVLDSRKAIVIALDGWSARFLGPYGNTWVETSALNALARDSLLIEYAYADTPNIVDGLSSLWQGRHVLCPPRPDAPSLGDLLAQCDRKSHLITDDVAVAHHPLAARMTAVTCIEIPDSNQPADDAMQTQFGQFMANVAESLESDESDCVWIHARAFTGSWDAPFELRLALTDDEEDPDPSRSVETPMDEALCDEDPDAAWSLARAYAAQVMSVDRCLEFLFEVIDNHPVWRESLLIVTAPRGYPLGEHGNVGLVNSEAAPVRLYGEVLHVPLFIRNPSHESLLLRSQAITQPHNILPTLLDWLGVLSHVSCHDGTNHCGPSLLGLFSEAADRHGLDRAISRTATELSIRTPQWFLRLANCDGDPIRGDAELFVKPDDRWEANEVADRCREVVEEMREVLVTLVQLAEVEKLDQYAVLPGIL